MTHSNYDKGGIDVLLVGMAGFNRGDDAIAASLLTILENTPGIRKISLTLQRLGAITAPRVNVILLDRKSPRYHYQLVSEILHSDLVIIGGGSIIQDELGANWFRGTMALFAEVVSICWLFRRTVISAPIGVDRLVSKIGLKMARFVLSKCRVLFVRDRYSREIAQKLLNDSVPIILSCDPAFFLGECQTSCDINTFDLVVTPAFEGRAQSRITELLSKSIEMYLRMNKSAKCTLLAMDERVREDAGHLDDLRDAISVDLRSRVGIEKPTTYRDTVRIIRGAKCILSMRLHSMIIGFGYAPIFCLSRGCKTDAIAEELRVPFFNIFEDKSDDYYFEGILSFFSNLSTSTTSHQEVSLDISNRFLRFQHELTTIVTSIRSGKFVPPYYE